MCSVNMNVYAWHMCTLHVYAVQAAASARYPRTRVRGAQGPRSNAANPLFGPMRQLSWLAAAVLGEHKFARTRARAHARVGTRGHTLTHIRACSRTVLTCNHNALRGIAFDIVG